MIWLVFALIAAFSSGVRSIIHRFVMKTESPYSYALVENVLTAIAFLPLLYLEFSLPTDYFAWALLGIASLLWVLISVIGYHAYKHTPVTLKDPISQTSVLAVFFLSVVLLSESVTWAKALGVLLVFLGLVILTFKKQNLFGGFYEKGVQLTLISAVLSSIVVIVDKSAMKYFTPRNIWVSCLLYSGNNPAGILKKPGG